eukprot:g6245.t1
MKKWLIFVGSTAFGGIVLSNPDFRKKFRLDDATKASLDDVSKASSSPFPSSSTFNREHYPCGLNHNFVSGKKEDLLKVFAGSSGKFESESRDVARCKRLIVKALGHLKGLNVADIGSGTGLLVPLLSAATGKNGKVFSLELSPAFREHLITKFKSFQNVEVVELTTDKKTGLASNSIDVALVCDVYHHLEFVDEYLTDVFQALKENGRFVVLDFHRDERHKSHPMPWIYEHVRADQSTFRKEIERNGFKHLHDIVIDELTENYIMVFEKRKT